MPAIRIKIVGAGLAGCSCARILAENLDCEIDLYEKGEIGGLCCDNGGEKFGGIYQLYGPHIFHTSNPNVIRFVLDYAEFNPFTNRPIAYTENGLARMPISIETIKDIKKNTLDDDTEFDKDCIFDNIIKDYSKKQWGKPAEKEVVDRLEIYGGLSGSYFNDLFEGIPKDGFSKMMERMIKHPSIRLIKEETDESGSYDFVIWTGPIDELCEFNEEIEWKGTKFVYCNYDFFAPRLAPVYNICTDYLMATRSTDIDQLTGGNSGMILDEFPGEYGKHYPICKDREKIDDWIKAQESKGLYCCGRLGTARYLDMDDTIENAMEVCEKIMERVRE